MESDIVYTRYADDLFFSTSNQDVLKSMPDIVESTLRSIPYPSSLRLNEAKTRHSSVKRRIRSRVHQLESLDQHERAQLAGLLAYAKDCEPAFFNRLVLKYGEKAVVAALPPIGHTA